MARRTRKWKATARAAHVVEVQLFGGALREKILLWLLREHYASVFRRQWTWSDARPHFFDHRHDGLNFLLGLGPAGVGVLFRGFYAAEMLRPTDRVLDIGCGDGFFDRRFFASRCAYIDAIDIDPVAIQTAVRSNHASNITYAILDAVNQPFPNESYDIIVCDGVIGHLSQDEAKVVLEKTRGASGYSGVFIGSESLGIEGHDHQQYFASKDDLRSLFVPYFRHIQVRAATYKMGPRGESVRLEAYWRCSNRPERLRDAGWESDS